MYVCMSSLQVGSMPQANACRDTNVSKNGMPGSKGFAPDNACMRLGNGNMTVCLIRYRIGCAYRAVLYTLAPPVCLFEVS
jgi:hypothetical protein